MTLARFLPDLQHLRLHDDTLRLVLKKELIGRAAIDRVPAYLFEIRLMETHDVVGEIDIRLGDTDYLQMYAGQLGYHINPPFRGQRFAARACLLVREVALQYGMTDVWITCNPENLASRRTCELIGAQFVEEVRVPWATELFWRGDRCKCRYHWNLNSPPPSVDC
jgi:tagatose 1,6-diphosphate aldolase